MEALINKVDFVNGRITIDGEIDIGMDKSYSICIRRREVEHGLEYPEEYIFPVQTNGNTFHFEKNVDDIFDEIILDNKMIWDIYLIHKDNYVKLKAITTLEFSSNYHHLLYNEFYKVKPYITGDKGLSFYLLQNSIQAIAKKTTFEQGILKLSIQIEQDFIKEKDNPLVNLLIKRREQEHHFEHYETKKIKPLKNDNLTFVVDTNDRFGSNLLSDKVIWDLFVEIKDRKGQKVEIPLHFLEKVKLDFNYYQFPQKELYKIKPYVTGRNQLALLIRVKEISSVLSKFEFDNNSINISGNISSSEFNTLTFDEDNSNLILKKRFTVGKEIVYYTEITNKIKILNNFFEIILDVPREVKHEVIRHNDIWDVFIRLRTIDGENVDVRLKLSEEYGGSNFQYELLKENPYFKFKPYLNQNGYLSFLFKKSYEVTDNAIKIAIFGSCFSRNPFNSSSYFNPDYKNSYNCIYTQFHSSIVSIMSNPIQIDLSKLDDISEKNKEFIRCDFEKDFLEKLKKSEPDYLIIDLYADAARDLIMIDDSSYISASLDLRSSRYYKEFMDYKQITHVNNANYLSLWEDYMKEFANRIKEIIPENKIILNIGGFTTKYYDNDNSIKKFPRLNIIKRNNNLWDKLNNLFLQYVPNCKIIDMRDTTYIGQYNHPYGKSFSHYQSGYYKEFMHRLNKLLLEDFQMEKSRI